MSATEADDGQGEPGLDGDVGHHESHTVYGTANQYGEPAAKDPGQVPDERHGGSLDDDLSGGEVDKVVIGQVGVVPIGPHVGGEVGIEVRVTEGLSLKSRLIFSILT